VAGLGLVELRGEAKIDKMSTLRKRIAGALEGNSRDLREISKLFGIKEKEVFDHLTHIQKSAHHRGFTVEPASCQQCGFSFKKRARLSTPGRCALCKSGHISPPRFRINNVSLRKSVDGCS
jgi:predicted Zn-ribbon and HTH transcriptional regulator